MYYIYIYYIYILSTYTIFIIILYIYTISYDQQPIWLPIHQAFQFSPSAGWDRFLYLGDGKSHGDLKRTSRRGASWLVVGGGWWWLVVVGGGWWWLVVVGGGWWLVYRHLRWAGWWLLLMVNDVQ